MLQLVVFALVSASFTNIYITQPVLPVLQHEFSADMVQVSFTVSAVILGIAISNLPFGILSDKLPIHPILLAGGLVVAIAGLVCAYTDTLALLIGARFVQGLFIPALTTCLAAYLARTLPIERLSVVMGSYVSATVLGGLGGRLLGGWIHPPLHWRYAFVSASIMILVATFVALMVLPKCAASSSVNSKSSSFLKLLGRWELMRIYLCASGSFAIFSAIFNYLPFRLTEQPFAFSTEITTLLYMVYIVGIFMGPLAGRFSNQFGSGNTMLAGVVAMLCSLLLILQPYIPAVIIGLLGICAGFFTIHSAAVGALNRRLTSGQGRANALYVMFYYLGGWLGITGSGYAYALKGWDAVICICISLLFIPSAVGISERRARKH
jgi:MFS transporter, YNFM family, putative membrane transport protein